MTRGHHLGDEQGQAAVEFALVAPILVAILLAIAQFGIVLHDYIAVTDAARAGARQASTARFSNDQGASAIAAADQSASDLSSSKLSVTVKATPDWSSAGNDVTVTVSYPYSIGILGWTVKSGTLTSTQTDVLE